MLLRGKVGPGLPAVPSALVALLAIIAMSVTGMLTDGPIMLSRC